MFEVQYSKRFISGNLKGIQVPVAVRYPTREQALSVAYALAAQPTFKTYEGSRCVAVNIQVCSLKPAAVIKNF